MRYRHLTRAEVLAFFQEALRAFFRRLEIIARILVRLAEQPPRASLSLVGQFLERAVIPGLRTDEVGRLVARLRRGRNVFVASLDSPTRPGGTERRGSRRRSASQ
jgi:hypothetical protein